VLVKHGKTILNPLRSHIEEEMAVCQNLVPLVNIKIAGKWMVIPLKMVLIGIDPYPNPTKKQQGHHPQSTPSEPSIPELPPSVAANSLSTGATATCQKKNTSIFRDQTKSHR